MAPAHDLAWFGVSWGSLGNSLWPQVDRPDAACDGCGEVFTATSQGIGALYGSRAEFYHRICWAPGPYERWDDLDEFGPAE